MSILDGLRQLVLEASENLMNEAAKEVVLTTAEASPTPMTGDLARSIVATPAAGTGSGWEATLQAQAQHASWTDEGTGIYVGRGRIYPVHAKVLSFFWILGPNGPGVYHFPSVAGQPGQKWWITHHPERWPDALSLALNRGALRA